MTEEKMEKAVLCEEELDRVAGGQIWIDHLPYRHYRHRAIVANTAAQDSEEAETLMGDFAQSKMEYEVRK